MKRRTTDNLVQDWPEYKRIALREYCLNLLGETPCDDLCVVGSRVIGHFTPTSDLDMVAWVAPEYLDDRLYYNTLRSEFDGMRLRLLKRDRDLRDIPYKQGKDDYGEGFILPHYSLNDFTLCHVDAKHIARWVSCWTPRRSHMLPDITSYWSKAHETNTDS